MHGAGSQPGDPRSDAGGCSKEKQTTATQRQATTPTAGARDASGLDCVLSMRDPKVLGGSALMQVVFV